MKGIDKIRTIVTPECRHNFDMIGIEWSRYDLSVCSERRSGEGSEQTVLNLLQELRLLVSR